VYGGYWAVTRAIAAGLAAYAVQTIAWSGGQVDLAQIACLQNGAMLDGGQVDVEVIVSSKLLSYIAWTPGEASPHTPAPRPPAPPIIRYMAASWPQWPASVALQLGSKGDAVKVLQVALRNSGIPGVRGIAVDGTFGNQTQTAVRNFQHVKGLTIDGIAGPKTRAALAALKDL
jgi:hypothetical protein